MNERKETPSNSNSSSTGEHSKFLFSLYSQFLLLLKVSAESEERVEGEKKKRGRRRPGGFSAAY